MLKLTPKAKDALIPFFYSSCLISNEELAKFLVKLHPSIVNMQYEGNGKTGLMSSLFKYDPDEYDRRRTASFSRWLLTLPGLDVNIVDRDGNSALHWASCRTSDNTNLNHLTFSSW